MGKSRTVEAVEKEHKEDVNLLTTAMWSAISLVILVTALIIVNIFQPSNAVILFVGMVIGVILTEHYKIR